MDKIPWRPLQWRHTNVVMYYSMPIIMHPFHPGSTGPVANFGSGASWFFILGGILFSFQPLITAGIILFSAAVLFQIVTLPVEFNASRRALGILQDTGILVPSETKGAKKY